ncbi:putative quinol monooxygenase [Oceanicella sp. SM1341]|uniref:putative quinol monooxygenase n=1 Tax=Oceanicella sp. SM1341 TaxID=1548889 RepID=UPI000E50AE5B|nr:putative quinol monooxygenase [Oceanicella sp. SM1341]
MTEITLIARLVARRGREEALLGAIAVAVPAARAEDGCIAYEPHVLADTPGTVVMYERWRDQAAFEAHGAGPAFTALAAQFDGLLAEPLRLEFLRRV